MAGRKYAQLLDPLSPALDQAVDEYEWRTFAEFDHIYRLTV
jgi:hypothetical protein